MFGRRRGAEDGAATKPGATAGAAGSAGVRALSQEQDLLRRAEWELLGEADRGALLAGYKPLGAAAALASGAAADTAADTAAALQDWVAGLVTPCLQPEAAAVIQGWLEDDTAEGHLYVGGSAGQGRRSLVASLARAAMARRPAPPEYCYAPDPAALERAMLLPVPRGTSASFGRALGGAVSTIVQNWDEAAQAGAGQNGQPSALAQLVASQLDGLARAAPAGVGDYVARLRSTWDALVARGEELPFGTGDLALANVDPVPESPTSGGAPVVAASLAQMSLADALLRANGGVLILSAVDVLNADGAWPTLSAALRARALPLKGGWPPVPLDVRVALIGSGEAYNALDSAEFTRLFRRETWLNGVIPWTREAEATHAALADGVARRYGLPAFEASGVARLIEEGARRTGGLNRTRLVTDLLTLRDLAADAGRIARARGAAATAGADVDEVLRRRRAAQGATARLVREAIFTGQEMTPTSGEAVGQINGLGVLHFHPPEGDFAVPTRISVTVSPGRDEDLIDVEREAEQADADHVRGTLTMEGYLASVYGRERFLNVSARVRFEQEHGTTGGDSASCGILFALLSALADVPIKLSMAVTGAVGQYGELQAIGGVNTKIEGFWEICHARREQGEQVPGGYAVVIPAVNARDLMLRADVAQSIAREGWFHVWPVSTVDEGLALLTGVAPAEIRRRVTHQLQAFHDMALRQSGAR